MKPVDVALVGLGGYGSFYIGRLLKRQQDGVLRFVGGVEPQPERCAQLDELKAAGVPVFADLSDFYAKHSAELVIICAPIHLHCPLTCMALERGSHVLCEKPLAATVQEGERMKQAERKAGRFVAIGYQWAFSDAIQQFKRDVMAGDFGRPKRLCGCVLWPRRASYYARNNWAGALKTPGGQLVLDSPANNATAHYLQIMLYVLGETRETSAVPVDVEAELYRANRIQNFDTAAICCRMAGDTEVLFLTSHAIDSHTGPVFQWEFEKGVVEFAAGKAASLRACLSDGKVRDYGNPYATEDNKLDQSLAAVRTGETVACGIEAARTHTLCINAAQESMPEVEVFAEPSIKVQQLDDGDTLTCVEGLHAALMQCFKECVMPHENGEFSWARQGKLIDLRGYKGL